MPFLYIRHTIVDYARWKEAFDCHLAARQAGGATDETLVWRNVNDSQEVFVLLGWCNLRQARLFSQSVSLQKALQEMGVVGLLEVRFLEEVG